MNGVSRRPGGAAVTRAAVGRRWLFGASRNDTALSETGGGRFPGGCSAGHLLFMRVVHSIREINVADLEREHLGNARGGMGECQRKGLICRRRPPGSLKETGPLPGGEVLAGLRHSELG